MLFFGNSIQSGVMAVIKTRIQDAQKSHDAECDVLEEQCENERMAANARRDRMKKESEEKHINSIIGKII